MRKRTLCNLSQWPATCIEGMIPESDKLPGAVAGGVETPWHADFAGIIERLRAVADQLAGGGPMTPEDMVDIFRKNIVVMYGVPAAKGDGAKDYLKVTDYDSKVGTIEAFGESRAVSVKRIEAADEGDPSAFLTWICNYEGNKVHYQTLTSERKFCFTATMNGCTFGIGSPTREGALIVSHANQKVDSNDIVDQSLEQATMTRKGLPEGSHLFQPQSYEFGPKRLVNTTLFGVYINRGWEFWFQQYSGFGSNLRLRTFQKIDQTRLDVV
ncbi:MAG: hypothetical protein ACREFO_04170 [Acetobacteraceae bacterium]